MKVLYSDDVMPIGKYKGQTIEDIIKHDPMYIRKFDGGKGPRNRRNGNLAISDETLMSIANTTCCK